MNHLSTVDIRRGKVSKTTETLDPNKAHGRNKISVRMLKICEMSIIKPLY